MTEDEKRIQALTDAAQKLELGDYETLTRLLARLKRLTPYQLAILQQNVHTQLFRKLRD